MSAPLSVAAAAKACGVPRAWLRRRIAAREVRLNSRGQVDPKTLDLIRALRAQSALEGVTEEAEDETTEDDDLRGQLLRARVGERRAIAKLRELELERETGRFVELGAVENDVRRVCAAIRERLLAVPSRTALLLETPSP